MSPDAANSPLVRGNYTRVRTTDLKNYEDRRDGAFPGGSVVKTLSSNLGMQI